MEFLGRILAALLIFAIPVTPGFAQDKPVTLSGDVKAVKTTTDASGKETVELVEPKLIVPGDRLVFGTDFENGGEDVVTDFVVSNAVHEAVRLAPDADPDLSVSVDGGTTWGTLPTLTVAGDDGAVRPASHADVTHVRWVIATIAPGEKGRVEFPVIVR